MRYVNLTPHAICVRVGLDERVFDPSGIVARVEETSVSVSVIDGVPVVKKTMGMPVNIPSSRAGIIYIVSAVVLARVFRDDVVAPDTGATAIRENGQVVAVTRWVSNTLEVDCDRCYWVIHDDDRDRCEKKCSMWADTCPQYRKY